MKIIQIADLHICHSIDETLMDKIITSMYTTVSSKIDKKEPLIFAICGDIVDKGNVYCYPKALKIINEIKSTFKDYCVMFEICPGNHDLNKNNIDHEFDGFTEFCNSVYAGYPLYSDECSVIIRKHDDLYIILMNSAYRKNLDYGSFNKDELEEKLKQIDHSSKKILVMHHTIISEYEKDNSGLTNAYDLINIAQEYNISAILHGHTHGLSELVIGQNKCKVIGVAPIFVQQQPNISLQFNFLDIFEGEIISVENFRYSDDTMIGKRRGGFDGKEYFLSAERSNSFCGNSIKEIYDSIVKKTLRDKVIYNLNISNLCKSNDFISDIETYFNNHLEEAKRWQLPECPEDIYFNHGMFLKYYDKNQDVEKNGADFIVEELMKKKTSSRAIMPLVNMKHIINVEDDYFLPSLMLMQCGFETKYNNKLFFTIYFRALEVSEFLKINLCEIYLIVKKIMKKVAIEDIQIEIHAFRAQYLENFSCFRKSKIDKMKPSEISFLVYGNKIDAIIDLLKDKLTKSETVIITDGLSNLNDSINTLIINEPGNKIFSQQRSNFNELSLAINELHQKRKITSLFTDIEEFEFKIKTILQKIISEIETNNIKES